MKVSDRVRETDSGSVSLKSKGSSIESREWGEEKTILSSMASPTGWVKLFLRERGKIVPGSHRESHNIWTNTGREYLALHQTIDTRPPPAGWTPGVPNRSLPFRVDNIGYIGVGGGSQVEDVSVLQLNSPLPYASGEFLAPIQSVAFPLTPSSTSVEYHLLFPESQISLTTPSLVMVSEMGLFTDGDPSSYRGSLPRDTSLANASRQAPVAYKTFEPVGKRHDLELEVFWTIRF